MSIFNATVPSPRINKQTKQTNIYKYKTADHKIFLKYMLNEINNAKGVIQT